MGAADTGLGRCGEAVWVGVLTCVFSLPVVTALAAQAAAVRALDPARSGTPGLTARYWSALRAAIGPGARLQLGWLGLGGLAAVDLAFGVLVDSGPVLGPAVTVLGAAGAVFLLLLRPGLAACLAARAADDGPPAPLRLAPACRHAVALVGVSPWRMLLLLVLDLAVLGTAVLTLAALPFVLGLALLAQTRLLAGAEHQLHRRAGTTQPPALRVPSAG